MWISFAFLVASVIYAHAQSEDDKVRAYLDGPDGYNARALEMYHRATIINWNYYTNITDYNEQLLVSIYRLD